MKTIHQKIQDGDYDPDYTYSPPNATQEERQANVLANRRKATEVTNRFRTDLEEEEGTSNLPEVVRDAVWDLAWNARHYSSYLDAHTAYSKYANLAKLAYKAGKEPQ